MAGGIYTSTSGKASGAISTVGITIENTGDVTAVRGGIVAGTFGNAAGAGGNAGVAIENSGDISATYGIYTVTKGNATGAGSNAGIAIDNEGDIAASSSGIYASTNGDAGGVGSNAGIAIDNAGDIDAAIDGISASTSGSANGAGSNAGIEIENTGDITAGRTGIKASASGAANVTVTILDGTVMGGPPGAGVSIIDGDQNTVNNYGTVTNLAGVGGTAILGGIGDETVDNYGVVTGNVDPRRGRQRIQQSGRRVVQFRHDGRSRGGQFLHQCWHAVAGRRRHGPHHRAHRQSHSARLGLCRRHPWRVLTASM